MSGETPIETGLWEIWIDDVDGELAMEPNHLYARRKIEVVEAEAYEAAWKIINRADEALTNAQNRIKELELELECWRDQPR